MPSTQRLPAKVLKRVRQIGRLGARGLVHTAYVRTMGPSVYSLTDPARSVAAELHRRRCVGHAIPSRLQQLKNRVPGEALPGTRPGRRLEFGENLGRFVQTLEAMLDLSAAWCAVPRVSKVEWESNTITAAHVDGVGFADEAARRPSDSDRIARLEEALTAIHRAGYVLGEVDESSLVFTDDGAPIIIGIEHAIAIAGLSRDMSIHLRDADREAFNRCFGTRLMTAASLRKFTSSVGSGERIEAGPVYAPVVIRDDISWGKIWNTDVGIGRWNFIMKEHLPIPVGGSVLDLGANNGFNPLQMLRAGAASAVGVEIFEPSIERGMMLKSAYEWLDNRAYDFRYIHGSQGDLAKFNLPRFDVVTALCSLYYLPDRELRDLVHYIRTLTNVLVLQCNTDRLINRSDEETYRKASVEYAVEVLEQAGFTQCKIVAPAGYSRPLVIGRAP